MLTDQFQDTYWAYDGSATSPILACLALSTSKLNAMGIYLHIGLMKTGSSFIQSFLARNALLLSELGHPYPDSGERDISKLDHISSGNGGLVMNLDQPIVENAIYSSELLYFQIPKLSDPRKFLRQINPTSILIFTRDLHEHSWSSYGQDIKRGRETLDYVDYIRLRYGRHLDRLLWWFEICADLNIDLKVWNYSRRKVSLINDFLTGFLMIQDLDTLSRFVISTTKVNRSLSSGELQIQRIFNSYPESPGNEFLSDRWINLLPDIEPATAPLTLEIKSTLESLFGSKVEKVNKFISEEDRILMWDPGLQTLDHSISIDSFCFTVSQLELIIDGIQSYLHERP